MRPSHWCAVAALLAASRLLPAQSNSISLTAPGQLTVSTAFAGSQPVTSTDQTARCAVTVVGARMKITGYLDTPMPAGVTLTLSIAAPTGAVSLGAVTLTGSAQDLVRYIDAGTYTGLTATFALTATVSAGVTPYTSSHVILTLTVDP